MSIGIRKKEFSERCTPNEINKEYFAKKIQSSKYITNKMVLYWLDGVMFLPIIFSILSIISLERASSFFMDTLNI